MKKLISTAAIVFSFSLLLTGCGGGGGSSNNNTENPESPITPSSATTNGTWYGTYSENGVTYELAAMTYDGKIYVDSSIPTQDGYGIEMADQYSGTFLVNNDVFSATLTSDQGITTTLSGTIDEQNKIDATSTSSDNSSGTWSLNYGSLYNEPSSQERIAGSWREFLETYYEEYREESTTITISSDGTVTGSDNAGCIWDGSITTPDTNHSLYLVDITISNCGDNNMELNGFADAYIDEQEGIDYGLNLYVTPNGKPSQWLFLR
ncbi:hypothetical protein [Thiomicrorhabdus sp.]|uniref:hypothetical protein n=1 Tax=Thiomicrorhabdus sp. TaxID=2039724 RepID=UPI00356B42BD